MQVLSTATSRRLYCATALLGGLFCAAAGTANAAPFTYGNLVLTRVAGGPNGDGSAALLGSSGANAVWIDEYTPTGSLVQSILLPTVKSSGVQKGFAFAGAQQLEGAIQISTDRRFFTVAGYNQTATNIPTQVTPSDPALGTNSSAANVVERVIARIAMDGTYDTSTALTDAVSAQVVRSAFTTNGTDMWIAGNGGSAIGANATNGIHYTTLGSSTSTILNPTSNVSNNRVVQIYKGQLYVSNGSTNGTAAQRGMQYARSTAADDTPVSPTGPSQNLYNLTGFTTAQSSNPDDYWFRDDDTLYMADTDNNATGGVQKYERTAGGGTPTLGDDVWTFRYVIQLGLSGSVPSGSNGVLMAHGVSGIVDASGNTIIYATSFEAGTAQNRLWAIVDGGSAATATQTVLAMTSLNNAFRGVEVVVPEPASLSLIGLAGLGILARRRK